jgi:hypothetical protein
LETLADWPDQSVEKPGPIRAGEEISARVPEQWIYQA